MFSGVQGTGSAFQAFDRVAAVTIENLSRCSAFFKSVCRTSICTRANSESRLPADSNRNTQFRGRRFKSPCKIGPIAKHQILLPLVLHPREAGRVAVGFGLHRVFQFNDQIPVIDDAGGGGFQN